MPTPLAHTNYEKLDLEIGRRLPLAKHLKDSLLGILVLHGQTLRAFEPAMGTIRLVRHFSRGTRIPCASCTPVHRLDGFDTYSNRRRQPEYCRSDRPSN